MLVLTIFFRTVPSGSFITRDPIKGILTNPQTQNPYTYSLNNPVNLSDPSGKAIPAILYLYLASIGASPDTNSDLFFLSQDWNNCDWGAVALDAAGLAIPGISAASLKILDKAVDVTGLINDAHHIFGSDTARHGLTKFLGLFGGDEVKAYKAILNEAQGLADQGKLPQEFYEGIPLIVNGVTLTVTGRIMDGVVKIGTVFKP